MRGQLPNLRSTGSPKKLGFGVCFLMTDFLNVIISTYTPALCARSLSLPLE